MKEIPNIIIDKDIFYLKEIFEKNNNLFYGMDLLIKDCKDVAVRDLMERIRNMHEDHMYFVVSSLKKENYFDGDIDE